MITFIVIYERRAKMDAMFLKKISPLVGRGH